MSYTPWPFDGFGRGLNLRDKADAVNEADAIDALNVEFSEVGAVQQRAGYEEFSGSESIGGVVGSLHPFYTSTGTRQLLVGAGTRLVAVDSSGVQVAVLSGLTDGIWDFVRFGAPGTEVAYAGQGSQTLRKWSGSAWSAVSGTPAAGALAVMAVEQGNRLVAGRFNTTTGGPTGGAGTSNPSRVYFSDPGDPETWGTNNFIDFTPGDGEKVQAVVAWREFVFVFKQSKFFVVYGSSEDSDGNPIFHYRTVDVGVGLASPRAVVSTHHGVYFLDNHSVFRTDGGDPEPVSDQVEPIFEGGASPYYKGGVLAHGSIENCTMAFHDHRLYLAFPTDETNDRVLVHDTHDGWWSLYDLPASAMVSFAPTDESELFFGTVGQEVHRHHRHATNDNGEAIVSRWRSGWFDAGSTDQKRIRESKVWGTGHLFLSVSTDFQRDTGVPIDLDLTDPTTTKWGGSTWGGGTWGGGRGLRPALNRRAVRGTVFSTALSNNVFNQGWALHRLNHHLADLRPPSKIRTS